MSTKRKQPADITTQDCLDFIVESFGIFRENGGIGTITPVTDRQIITSDGPGLVIYIPGVEERGEYLQLVEYATNTATNGDGREK